MANAEKTVKEITKTVYETKDVIVLELTEDEAIFLKACMTKVAGDSGGLRGVADSIAKALDPIVGKRYFIKDAWFKNDYYRTGERCGYSFDDSTSVKTHIVKDLPKYGW